MGRLVRAELTCVRQHSTGFPPDPRFQRIWKLAAKEKNSE